MNNKKLRQILEFSFWGIFIAFIVAATSFNVTSINHLLLKIILWIFAVLCFILAIKSHNLKGLNIDINYKKIFRNTLVNLILIGLFFLTLFASKGNILIISLYIIIAGFLNSLLINENDIKNYFKKELMASSIIAVFFEIAYIYYLLLTQGFYCENCSMGILVFLLIIFLLIIASHLIGITFGRMLNGSLNLNKYKIFLIYFTLFYAIIDFFIFPKLFYMFFILEEYIFFITLLFIIISIYNNKKKVGYYLLTFILGFRVIYLFNYLKLHLLNDVKIYNNSTLLACLLFILAVILITYTLGILFFKKDEFKPLTFKGQIIRYSLIILMGITFIWASIFLKDGWYLILSLFYGIFSPFKEDKFLLFLILSILSSIIIPVGILGLFFLQKKMKEFTFFLVLVSFLLYNLLCPLLFYIFFGGIDLLFLGVCLMGNMVYIVISSIYAIVIYSLILAKNKQISTKVAN